MAKLPVGYVDGTLAVSELLRKLEAVQRKAALVEELVAAINALMRVARYYPGDSNLEGDAQIDAAYALGEAAIRKAEAK